jgi:glycosyltransferase involved in cell wall biosynthesis
VETSRILTQPLELKRDKQLRIGYLINQYPKISHTFVRTEIAGLEALGSIVQRFSIRPTPDQLVDSEDIAEEKRTRVLLRARSELLLGVVQACKRPGALARAVTMAVSTGINSERGLARHLVYLAEACVLRKWAHESSVQHIHAHFGTNSATVAMLCHELGGPRYSFTVHGPEEFDKPGPISLSKKIQHAAFVVAVSNFGRAQLWRHTPAADWGKIQVVRCGVDRRFLERAATAVPEAGRLVCVGRLSEQKGQLVLLRAASELKESGINFELVLVGDGELRPMLEAAIDDMGLRENVRITGWQSPEQVREHIENSRAMVLPSFAEGLPVVIMESLASHRPVISTYVAGIPELVVPGETGWLVPAGAISPLVTAMKEALECHPSRLAELGLAGHKRVCEQHDAGQNAQQLNRHICDVATSDYC